MRIGSPAECHVRGQIRLIDRRIGVDASTEPQSGADDIGANWNKVLEGGGILVGKRVQIELELEAVLRAS
jgi:hypothetical protein